MANQKSQPPTKNSLKEEYAFDTLWRKGFLMWKLNTAQQSIYKIFYKLDYKIPVFQQSRRTGKSWTLITLAIEQALRHPGSIIHYAAPTGVMAKKIIIPTMRKILADCPKDLMPQYFKNDGAFEFHNESKIEVVGVDEGNAERLRGSATNLGIVDEAGFVDDLEYVVNDILYPQTLTTNGKLILSSTPPKSSGHPFYKFVRKAEMNDSYVRLTIEDVLELIKNDNLNVRAHLSPEAVAAMKDHYGGETSSTWRREFMCVYGDAIITVQDTEGNIKNMTLRELHNELYKTLSKSLL